MDLEAKYHMTREENISVPIEFPPLPEIHDSLPFNSSCSCFRNRFEAREST